MDPILVTGTSAPERTRLASLSRAISPKVPSDEPLPRFADPVCFATVGLDRATLEQINDRLVADADQAGLALAGSGCRPNVTILFVDGIAATFERLRHRDPMLFGQRTPDEIREIARQAGPVRAWSIIETRSRDGDRIGAKAALASGNGILTVATSSRLFATIRRDVLASVVLVERSSLVGKTTRQIADYLALRSLAAAHPEAAIGEETILSLFGPDGQGAPTEMTAFDRGYLQGLYSGSPNQLASLHQALIVRTILRARAGEGSARPTPVDQ